LVLYGLKLQHPNLRYSDYLSGQALAEAPLIPVTCATAAVFGTLPASDFAPRSAAALRVVHRYLEENALPQRRASGRCSSRRGRGRHRAAGLERRGRRGGLPDR